MGISSCLLACEQKDIRPFLYDPKMTSLVCNKSGITNKDRQHHFKYSLCLVPDWKEKHGYLYSNNTIVIQNRKGWLIHDAKVVAYLETRSAGDCVESVSKTHEPIALTQPIAAPAATPPNTIISIPALTQGSRFFSPTKRVLM
jgi:hypothetical protein